MAKKKEIRRVALVGAGLIGGGWAARCLAHGLDVVACDPGPDAEAKLRATVANAWPALVRVGLKPGASQSRLSFAADPESAVKGADFIQESASENEDLKRRRHARIDAAAPPGVIRQEDLGGGDRRGGLVLPPDRHASPEGEGRGAGLHRRPAAARPLARGASSDHRWRMQHERHRRCDPIRSRPALVLPRHLPDLSSGGRGGWHGSLHEAVWALAPPAVDEAQGTQGDARTGEASDRRDQGAGRRQIDQGAGAVPRRLPDRG